MLELDHGRSMREVYGTDVGFYQALVKAAECSYVRSTDDNWMAKLRFLTPDEPTSSTGPSGTPQPSEDRAGCACADDSYQTFTGHESTRLRLTSFGDVLTCSHYVAISYCWRSFAAGSCHGPDKHYEIVTSSGTRRNIAPYDVIKRAVDYAAYRQLPFIWIDQECIDQNNEQEKQSIVGEMDRIYRQARRVVALTSTTVRDPTQLEAIQYIREFNRAWPPIASTDLAELLAKDEWFDRAWTLQENIQSARFVDILIPLDSAMSYPKYWKACRVSNQDAIMSQKGLRELGTAMHVTLEQRERLDTGYTLYKSEELKHTSDLSRHRLSCFDSLNSLVRKGLTVPSDRLSIIANMSAYRVRLDYSNAKKSGLDIGTCVFAQALLNGDMSIVLAYRQFLDPEDSMTFECFKIASSQSLSCAMFPMQAINSGYASEMFRCRISPPSIEPQGIRAHGQLWIKKGTVDFPVLVCKYYPDSCDFSPASSCHGACISYANQILQCLAYEDGDLSAFLAYSALRLSEYKRSKYFYNKHGKLQKRPATFDYAPRRSAMFTESEEDKMVMHLESMFTEPERGRVDQCHLRSLLEKGRICLYVPLEDNNIDNVPMILWNDTAKRAPEALFVPTRVLMEGEKVPECLLVWSVRSNMDNEHSELRLDDHLPRKIQADPAEYSYSTPLIFRVVCTGENWSSLVTGDVGRDFLLKLDGAVNSTDH